MLDAKYISMMTTTTWSDLYKEPIRFRMVMEYR